MSTYGWYKVVEIEVSNRSVSWWWTTNKNEMMVSAWEQEGMENNDDLSLHTKLDEWRIVP